MSRKPLLPAILALLASTLLAAPAAAQSQTSVSGMFFTEYTMPTDGRLASFNVTRAFFTGKARFSDVWSGAITYNAAPLFPFSGLAPATPTPEPHNAILQSAYLQATGLLPDLTLQMGMVSNPWFDFETAFWGYRMLGFQYYPVFHTGLIPAYDLGLKATGKLGPLGYVAQVDNGSGSRATENSARKAYTAGLSMEPFTGLTLAAFGYRGDNPTLAQFDRYGAFAGYRGSGFRVAAEAIRLETQALAGPPVSGQILSAYSVVGLPIPVLPSPELIARVDIQDGNISAAPVAGQAESVQGIVGFSVKPAPGVTLVLDDQITRETIGGASTVRNTLALHTQFTF